MALPHDATGCLQFVIVVFSDHTHLLFLSPIKLINSTIEFVDLVMQHFLPSVTRNMPYVDSEIYHIRHFIKIQFVNKRVEFIN